MKSFAFVALAGLGLVTGCAASAEDSTGGASDEVNAAPSVAIQLPESSDAQSVQGKLFTLLQTFRNEPGLEIASGIESAAYFMSGANDSATRSVSCHTSSMELVSPGGGGFEVKNFFSCSLEGFATTRVGGDLPNVVIPYDKEAPLAGKLYQLLRKGFEKGDLGVEHTGGNSDPPCCDIPSSDTLAIRDGAGNILSCTNLTGGFAFIVQARCSYSRPIAPNE